MAGPENPTAFRLTGELRVIVEEQGGKRTKDAGHILARDGAWFAGGVMLGGKSVHCNTLEEAIAKVVVAYEAADRKTGGI